MKKILSHVENDPHSMAHDSLTEVSSTQKGKSRKSRKAKSRRLKKRVFKVLFKAIEILAAILGAVQVIKNFFLDGSL